MESSAVIGQLVPANLILAVACLSVALSLRPWKLLGETGPPWPWLALASLMPLLWSLDRHGAALAQTMSGAALLVLFAGWPLALLSMVPVAVLSWAIGDLSWLEALQRYVWLGAIPATFTLAIGALLRRHLPHHLFIYILGRGFIGTFTVCVLAGLADLAMHSAALASIPDELMIARLLSAFAEAFLTGLCVAIAVAFRPHWLATYSDRLYLLAKH